MSHIFVGVKTLEIFLLNSGVSESKVHVTGNVNFEILQDLCIDQFSSKKLLSEKYEICLAKSWVFLPMNYAWAFISDKEIIRRIEKGYHAKNAWIYRDYAKKCLEAFLFSR